MKTKIAGIISFIGSMGYLIFAIVGLVINRDNLDIETLIAILSVVFFTTSTLLYLIWANFTKPKKNELAILDYENEILKKKIEQQELKKKLEK